MTDFCRYAGTGCLENRKDTVMVKNKKILRKIILALLLICTAFLIYSIVKDPLGKHDIMFALTVTVGFIALDADEKKHL